MHPRDLGIADFTYPLPDERIAKYPLAERDASKLLVYNNGSMTEDVYRNIAAHIPAGALMVFNQTKVVNARLLFRKPTGGAIEVFCLGPDSRYGDVQTAMLQKGSVYWECIVGGAAKWKKGVALHLLHSQPGFTLTVTVAERLQGSWILQMDWDNKDLTFAEVLHFAGKVPLPPYLHRDAEAGDESRYQTLYARDEGSVAAPTAGLHFTPLIMQRLAERNISSSFVTLHVGAGTFRPVKSATMETHEMHAEWIEVTMAFIEQLLAKLNDPIIAVGTTSLRTLESLYWIGNKLANRLPLNWHDVAVTQWDPYESSATVDARAALVAIRDHMAANNMRKLVTRTQVLIAPGYRFGIVKGLVTNFHQPQSTLLLLVAAFIGSDWRKVYDYAMHNDFRFLSYGDGCLLWRNDME